VDAWPRMREQEEEEHEASGARRTAHQKRSSPTFPPPLRPLRGREDAVINPCVEWNHATALGILRLNGKGEGSEGSTKAQHH
jgi:hypothetical protein